MGVSPLGVLGTACILVMFLAALALAAGPEGAASRPVERKAPPVTALDLSGRAFTGKLVQVDVPGVIRLDVSGKPIEIPAGNVIWLGFDLRPDTDPRLVQWFSDPPAPVRGKPKSAVRVRLVLRDGQVLSGLLQDPRKTDALAIDHRLLGSIDLPFGQLKGIRIQVDAEDSATRKITASAGPPAAFDVIWLANGDRIEGILRSLASDKASIELASGQLTQMPTASVQVVRLAEVAGPTSATASQRTGASAWLCLPDGERIVTAKLGWDREHAAITITWQGRAITLSAGDLVGIEPAAGNRQWLTDLSPARYEHQPLLAPLLRWQADANASGTPIFWNARAVLHAVGMPAGSTIRYDLGGGYTRLVVWPILDDSTIPGGSCNARIVADGHPLWQGTVKAGSSTSASIDLSGKRELILQVEAGEGGDVLTRFVWAWPVLVR